MSITLNNLWTYRLRHVDSDKIKYRQSLQVYNKEENKWVHTAFIRINKISKAITRYHEGLKHSSVHPVYLRFSINHLIELHNMIPDCHRYFPLCQCTEVLEMLTEVTNILEITLEVNNE